MDSNCATRYVWAGFMTAWLISVYVPASAASWDPAAADYTGRRGVTLHVSKLGDGTDGRSWSTAFTTVQAALDAIPDDQGGHRIVVRPDTYMEANLSPAHPGAAGAYNVLVGDVDGRLGSGTRGRVILDAGDPNRGFKSYDWWGNIRSTTQGWSPEHTEPTFSAIIWDRWIVRQLYATGGDGGLFWDCTNRIEPFTIVVEDCVSIGRAFGGGVASCLSRPDEPITFRRCTLWALDFWGDTAGAYVRVENPTLPDRPDVLFEDCTLVSPECALKCGNYGFHTSMRVRVNGCRLVTLNFSQPAGTPSDGIIQSVEQGKYLHVELEDSTLMGYKVFGVKVNPDTVGELGYTVAGSVRAYVQHTQETPPGMHRLGHWPTEVFDAVVPPPMGRTEPWIAPGSVVIRDRCEVAPLIWKGRLCLLECVRPGSGGAPADYYLLVRDVETGEQLARFGEGHGLASAHVHNDALHVFAARYEQDTWNDVTLFRSKDLEVWDREVVIKQEPGESLFNSSICAGPDGFVMAYETNDPAYPAFTVKFARSADLQRWTKIDDAVFGTDRYTACPCIRHVDGMYYLLYLERRQPRWYFETFIARSRDLRTWELSPANPVLAPTALDDGINASDVDLIEHDGRTYVYYAVGDQRTWMNIKRTEFSGSEPEFLKRWFVEGH
jgi:hypothetical protein